MKFQTKLIHAVVLGALGVATSAHAVNLGDDGRGEVLIYPYYTTHAGNDTLISVVNTTAQGKAVKVRVLESLNSREVIDFNLYLSPSDAWSAVITADATTGGAKLKTFDKSCTAPQLTATADGGREVSFRNFAYVAPTADNGPAGLARTKEGYIEIIEMGTVNNNFELITGGITFGKAITHVAGVPGDCAALSTAWGAAGNFQPANGLTDNTGGLIGSGSIINVGAGTDYSFDPVALEAFRTTAGNTGNHTEPGSMLPSLASSGNGALGTLPSAIFYGPVAGAVTVDDWAAASTPFAADPVSAVLMRRSVLNEFTVNPAIGGGTDMVVTFPTKRFYVQSATTFDAALLRRPFRTNFLATGGTATGACEPVSLSLTGREEEIPTTQIDFSPKPQAGGNALCWEANVVTISNSNVLGSPNALNINSPYTDGWAAITFANNTAIGGSPVGWTGHQMVANGLSNPLPAANDTYNGLPVVGFAVQKYVNGNVGGVLSNYGGAFAHKYVRLVN